MFVEEDKWNKRIRSHFHKRFRENVAFPRSVIRGMVIFWYNFRICLMPVLGSLISTFQMKLFFFSCPSRFILEAVQCLFSKNG